MPIEPASDDTERFTDEQCGHCGGWMKTDGSDLWCPNSHGMGPAILGSGRQEADRDA